MSMNMIRAARPWCCTLLLLFVAQTWISCDSDKPTPTTPTILPALKQVVIGGNVPLTRIGETVQLKGMANLSDGTTIDVTSGGTWQVADERILTIDTSGLATVIGFGLTTVRFSYQTQLASVTLTATPAGTYV